MSRREEVEKKLADIDFANSDYEGNWHAVRPLARTLADEVDALRAELRRVKAGPNLIQYDDELAAIYRIEDDRAKYLAMDSLCRRLASEADEMLEQTVELKQQLARVKAESLRVVPMTEDRSPINIDTVVRHAHINGRVVRLERWETEE